MCLPWVDLQDLLMIYCTSWKPSWFIPWESSTIRRDFLLLERHQRAKIEPKFRPSMLGTPDLVFSPLTQWTLRMKGSNIMFHRPLILCAGIWSSKRYTVLSASDEIQKLYVERNGNFWSCSQQSPKKGNWPTSQHPWPHPSLLAMVAEVWKLSRADLPSRSWAKTDWADKTLLGSHKWVDCWKQIRKGWKQATELRINIFGGFI